MSSWFQSSFVVGWLAAGIVVGLSFSFIRRCSLRRFVMNAGFFAAAAVFIVLSFSGEPKDVKNRENFSQVSTIAQDTLDSFQYASNSEVVPMRRLPENPITADSDLQNGASRARTAEFTTNNQGNEPLSSTSFQSSTPKLDEVLLSQTNLSSEPSARALQRCDTIEKVKMATVVVEATILKDGSRSPLESVETGSGVIVEFVGKNGGKRYGVLTNYHVAGTPVHGPEDVNILFNKDVVVHPVSVLGAKVFDLTLLLLDNKDVEPYLNKLWIPAKLGNSDSLVISDPVWTVGAPYGLSGSVSQGIVSYLDRHKIPLGTENQVQGFIQTDASVNPGNSGGPLVNENGEVVGIVVAIASKNGESSGVSFAIPINNVVMVAEQLMKNHSFHRPYVGVQLDRTFDSAEKCAKNLVISPSGNSTDVPKVYGTRISKIVDGSPAAAAGLHQGDIICKYNGKYVENEEHFEYMIALSEINSDSRVEVLREGKSLAFNLVLKDKEAAAAQAAAPRNN